MEHVEGKVLGQRVEYPKNYCPSILVAIPRSLNREIYDIDKPEELFCGYDSWHVYEASFLLANGMPVVGLLKIVYPSTSPFIIESKSLKLYMASYNMTPMGATREEGIRNFVFQVTMDLGKILSTKVTACFYQGIPSQQAFDFEGYPILEDNVPVEGVTFSVYQEYPAYLHENICREPGELKAGSHLLKSNCKITCQPDWGSLYLHLKGNCLPDKASLLKYIVSLRNENHFHEEICEMVFKRLTDIFQPEHLMVCCLYTRRGGIDICPVRAKGKGDLPRYLPFPDQLTVRMFRQ